MKIKGIIFDMDGTIIDTEIVWKNATYDLVKYCGMEIDENVKKILDQKLHGLALDKACTFIKNLTGTKESVEGLVCRKKGLACNSYKSGIKFIEGFNEFFEIVKEKRLKTAIATNADQETLEIAKEKLKLGKLFGDKIFDIAQVNNISKPDPAIYLHALKNINLSPKECVAIEDSAHGIEAAKEAGIFCIGINTAGSRNNLSIADHVVEFYNEIDLDSLNKEYF